MSRAAEIRDYRPDDLDALYAIALATGDAGDDASRLYADPRLLGHVYVGPYAALEPDLVLVAEDAEGVGGYILGTADTAGFAARAEAQWWPALRSAYPDPGVTRQSDWTADRQRHHRLHHPPRMPDWLLGPYPSHLHINLLPRCQGRGLGRRMVAAWLARLRGRGAPGVHLGVDAANGRAVGFYRACGFRELPRREATMPQAVWFALELAAGR